MLESLAHTTLPSFFRLLLGSWIKSFLCNLSYIRNKTPSLNPLWPKPGLFWTISDCVGRFILASTLFQRTSGRRIKPGNADTSNIVAEVNDLLIASEES